ncbi:MAG: V-type ATPase subunit [Lachnospiraceae bacterium]|nr:V-type ATPase subunit [Lachnospiraceae bacterium]
MSGLLAYSGLTTKMRAMQSRFLEDSNFRELVELESVPQAVSYLKQKPSYEPIFGSEDENQLHRGTIERMLRQSIYRDFTKLYRFSNVDQRRFLNLYFKRYEVTIIKECLTNLFDHRNTTMNLSAFEEFFEQHSKLNLALMTASTTIDEFVESLRDTDYYAPFAKLLTLTSPTLFDYEMTLDLYYFSEIWKMKDKLFSGKDLNELTKAYGNKFDMLNLQWIYRSKCYYHMNAVDIYALLIPSRYRLKPQEIRAMVESENRSSLEGLIQQTYYGKHYQNFSLDTLESMYAAIMKQVLSGESRKNPYSVATIYSYLYHKEHEVNRIIIALECVRYRIAPDEAMKHVATT